MSSLTELIKDLRNKTGAGFLDCKNALSENNNDLDKSIEFLRKKGLAKASKKTSREANEGAIGIYSNKDLVVVLKVNSETDFAAKSETFLSFLDQLGDIFLKENNPNLGKEDFINLKYKDGLISDFFKSMIAKIGENLILNDLITLEKKDINISYYIHNSYKENIGKIISLIQYKSDNNEKEIETFSKNLCMHIAAMKPESMDVNDLDEKIVNNEKSIQKELILNSGKPSNIADKILEGKMKKFYSEVTLLNQSFILDQEKTVKNIIDEKSDKYNYKLISFNLISL